MPRRTPPRQITTLLATAICFATTGAVVLASAAPARAGSSYFTSSANSARSSHGLAAYAVAGDLSSIAQRHAQDMAARHSIYHNPSLASQACCWRSLGENVGEGRSQSQVQSAFMNSAPHRANILSSTFGEIGVGVAKGSDGNYYVDEVFRARTGSSGSARATRTTTTRSTSSPARRYRTATATPVTRPTVLELLAAKVRAVGAVHRNPRDPVAAAMNFSAVMVRLTH